MGYTPVEGIVMARRSGTVDPVLMLELMRQGWTDDQLSNLLWTQSRLRDLSGFCEDMQELRCEAIEGHGGA